MRIEFSNVINSLSPCFRINSVNWKIEPTQDCTFSRIKNLMVQKTIVILLVVAGQDNLKISHNFLCTLSNILLNIIDSSSIMITSNSLDKLLNLHLIWSGILGKAFTQNIYSDINRPLAPIAVSGPDIIGSCSWNIDNRHPCWIQRTLLDLPFLDSLYKIEGFS